jgi:hypothetical protein
MGRTPKDREASRGSARGGGAAGEEWVFGRRQAPFLVEEPSPRRPHILLLVEPRTGVVTAVNAVEPDAGDAEVVSWIDEHLPPPLGLRLEDERLAERLRQRLGPERPVRVGATPELEAVLDSLVRFGEKRSTGARREKLAWKDDAAAEARAGFYEAAARFERAEPWKVASDVQVLAVDVPALGWNGTCASILGAAEESFGLLLLRSLDDYVALLRLSDLDPAARRHVHGGGVPLFSITYGLPRGLPGGKQLAKEARALGWKPGLLGRLPYILKMGPDGVPQALTTGDYRLATACLEGVKTFVGKHASLFEEPPKERIRWSASISMPGGAVDVVVKAPPPDLPWEWGSEDPFDGLRRREGESLLAGFEASRRASGAAEAEVAAATHLARDLLEFKSQRAEPMLRWSPEDVEEYLLEHVPARLTLSDEEIEATPAHLQAFFDWLAASGTVPAASLRATQARVEQCREAFLRHARDPSRFGPAKTIVTAALAAGVDLQDNKAMKAFLDDFNRRLAEDPSLLPLPGDRRGKRPKAWTWDGEGPPPDPRGPCPCGSGQRYRRCCMPR